MTWADWMQSFAIAGGLWLATAALGLAAEWLRTQRRTRRRGRR